MRKIAIILAVFTLLMLTACGTGAEAEEEQDENTVVIKEKLFSEQVNYIYLNTEKFMGKTIKYEGLMNIIYDRDGTPLYYCVIRYGPGGCCGNDGTVGFEIRHDEYPVDNDWVAVEGTLCSYDEGMYKYLYLDVTSLEVLPERGQEYVD